MGSTSALMPRKTGLNSAGLWSPPPHLPTGAGVTITTPRDWRSSRPVFALRRSPARGRTGQTAGTRFDRVWSTRFGHAVVATTRSNPGGDRRFMRRARVGHRPAFSAPSTAMANAGSVVMTSGLSIADHLGSLSGRGLIAWMVAGVEAAGRVQSCVGRVPQVTLGFHGPGFSTLGATACAARAVTRTDGECAPSHRTTGELFDGHPARWHGQAPPGRQSSAQRHDGGTPGPDTRLRTCRTSSNAATGGSAPRSPVV
jgi:hypothetical protein